MEFYLALALTLLINLTVFMFAYWKQTDKLTDITYSISFIALALLVLLTSSGSAVSYILVLMVSLWAVRLGTFLGRRIHKIGRDRRFDDVRSSFWKFGRFWALQGLSVWIVMVPAIYLLDKAPEDFKALSIVGLAVWAIGLVIETVADNQKFAFSKITANKDKWIESGLWRYSRHPNYLGEMMVWIGIYLFALPYLSGWQVVLAKIGPLWICGLLLFVTGIPTTEKSADKKWGHLAEYQSYKKRISKLIPSF